MQFKKATFLLFSLCSLAGMANYPNPSFLIEELMKAKVQGHTELSISPTEKASLEMKRIIDTHNQGTEEEVDNFLLTFKIDNKETKCESAVVKNSERFRIGQLPIGFRDRGGLLLLGDCKQEGKSIELNALHYAVLPADKTLPLGNISKTEGYRVYKSFLSERPQMLCTDRDTNSDGLPRSQSIIHKFGDTVHFFSIISTSSPSREVDGQVIWSNDRPNLFDEIDQGSLPEVKETLELLGSGLEGRISLSFKKEDCIDEKLENLNVLNCSTDVSKERSFEFRPEGAEKAYQLSHVRAEMESIESSRIQLGVAGQASSVHKERSYSFTYTFIFNTDKGPKYYRVKTGYAEPSSGSLNECVTSN